MSFSFRWAVLGLLLLAAGQPARAQAPAPPDGGPVTYQMFYDALSPYGQWVNDPDYGYVWLPSVGPNFQPYGSNGHWVYTDYGWTWVSDYAWGWAPFHYGRWRFSDPYGWVWVPGYRWGPAWVAWRQSAGYYGWAPLGPPPVQPGVRVNIGFSFSFGNAPVVPARWYFVPAAYVASPRIATYYLPPARTTVLYNQTTIINNTYVNKTVNNTVHNTTVINNQRERGGYPAGPARADVEKATGQPLQQVAVTSRNTPGVGVQGNSLAFYRPDVKAPNATASAPAPRHTVALAEAARQARAAQPGTGLLPDKAAQQLSSTDAQPFRAAHQRAAQPASAAPPTPRPSNQPASAAPPTPRLNNQPATIALPTPRPNNQPVNAAPPVAPADLTSRQERQQARQARQQALAGQPKPAPTPDQQQQRAQRQAQQQQPLTAPTPPPRPQAPRQQRPPSPTPQRPRLAPQPPRPQPHPMREEQRR
ncbi:DUF6600 domain-containing protein [Hymenobacter psoromatis]|uniref:DUF6600 domain-containing protein n=1 Tax=Hymenobacter psoromatis TaxID=1484116 RepID=UPI001CC1874F|nr:DUF6600 domain-containing protein [Hymenobacter psoromatis]